MNENDPRTGESYDALEGMFDAQLPLPGQEPRDTQPLDRIVKRDGRTELFDKSKIARAIHEAGAAEGGYDDGRAANFATAVAIYLSKHLDHRPPTVEDVHIAVERVLMKMGHYKAATAFVRFRERRARMRALHDRATAPVAVAGEPGPHTALQIRTSAETVEPWDRRRIVTALVRETDIPETTAVHVAEDVERQILSADVGTLTTALVRELVTARLIDLGLASFARRHRRLGVPLYDTETILCGPSPAHVLNVVDPEATDWMLAESVKKEFALSQVYSSDVAEAHLLGDVHIHGLAMVDRLFSARHSIDLVKRFGMDILGAGAMLGPPRALDVLSAEFAGISMALQRHFCGLMEWRAATVFLAPFVEGLTDNELAAWAEMTLRDLAMTSAVNGRPMPPVTLELCWHAPPSLAGAEAVGPGGTNTGRSYADYDFTTERAASAMARAFMDLRRRGVPITSPAPLLRMTHSDLRDPAYQQILSQMAALATAHRPTCVAFDRTDPWLVGEDTPWRSSDVCFHTVTLNMPRAGFRGGRPAVLDELQRMIAAVASAHAQKLRLLSRILDQGEAGPLALIARRREGACIHRVEQAEYHVGIVGLNECVRCCTGQSLHESDSALSFAQELLEFVQAQCRHWSETMDVPMLASATTDPSVSTRLARLDADLFSRDVVRVLAPGADEELAYTEGAQFPKTSDLTPGEHVRLESVLHERLDGSPTVRIAIPDADTSVDSIAAFLTKSFRQTNVKRVRFE